MKVSTETPSLSKGQQQGHSCPPLVPDAEGQHQATQIVFSSQNPFILLETEKQNVLVQGDNLGVSYM